MKDTRDEGHAGLEGDKKLEVYEELGKLRHPWVLFQQVHCSEWVSLAVLPVASLKGVLMSPAAAPPSPEPGAFLAALRSGGQLAFTRLSPVPAAALTQAGIRVISLGCDVRTEFKSALVSSSIMR